MRLTFLLTLIVSITARAWIYPEHRAIAIVAIQRLNEDQRAQLERLWSVARIGHEHRLTATTIVPEQGRRPQQLDYAAWTGIAGDHSCSSYDMLRTILTTDWILKVADITARLQSDLARAKYKSQRNNFLRKSDIRLEHADEQYASRAGSSNVHFLMSRLQSEVDADQYLAASLRGGEELNALGAYSWHHLSALRKAMLYASGTLPPEKAQHELLSAFADEAFALHFLEDVFAAGHIAGTWGATSVRKGTHDYYNEKGLEIVTWDGRRTIMRGDAFMTSQDAMFAEGAVRESLGQFLLAAAGTSPIEDLSWHEINLTEPDTFNICANRLQMDRNFNDAELYGILRRTPVPGLSNGEGELPRFRSEVGLFAGFSSGVNLMAVNGGFASGQEERGGVSGLEANVRVGFGLDGILNQSGDGLIFFQAGFRQDGPSSNLFVAGAANNPFGSISSAIPGRSAYNFRLRLPYWLVPGDLVLAAPLLLPFSKKTMTNMVVTATNGGVLRMQSGISSTIGRFQFVAGREIGVSLYGALNPRQDALIIPVNGQSLLVQYSSVSYDFPIIEYKPMRTFSMNQASAIVIQLTTGVDVPFSPTVVLPAGDPAPELKHIWHVGLRMMFDWRRYF